jgi:hypothetical protein
MFRNGLAVMSQHNSAMFGGSRKQGRIFPANRCHTLGHDNIELGSSKLNSSQYSVAEIFVGENRQHEWA